MLGKLLLLLLLVFSITIAEEFQNLICDDEQRSFFYKRISLSDNSNDYWVFFCGFDGTGNGSTLIIVKDSVRQNVLLNVSDIRTYQILSIFKNGLKDIAVYIREESDEENVPYQTVVDTFSFENGRYKKRTNHSNDILTDSVHSELKENISKILTVERNKEILLGNTYNEALKLFKSENQVKAAETLYDFVVNNKVTLSSATVQILNDLAYFLEQTKNYNKAESILNEIIEMFPDRVVAYINLGDTYFGLKNTVKAKDAYLKYIDLMKKENKESKIPKRVFERVK
jgi:tetratricopeptide (TPR) repeat protein